MGKADDNQTVEITEFAMYLVDTAGEINEITILTKQKFTA